MRRIKKKNRHTGKTFFVLGLLLLTAAFSLTMYNRWDAARADQAAQAIAEKLEEEIASASASEKTDIDSDTGIPAVELDGNLYIGLLEIPSLDLSLPIMAEWDYVRLKTTPCRYYGSCETDDLVIAGHNYARHFSPLKWIRTGSDVYFTDTEGTVYHYIVDNVETLMPEQVDEMIGGDWDLTLFTCTTGGQSRCTVRCVRED